MNGTHDVGALRGMPSSVNQLSSRSSLEAPPRGGESPPTRLPRTITAAPFMEVRMKNSTVARLLLAASLAGVLMPAASTAVIAAGPDAKQEVALVDVNSASVEELMSVPGIGQVVAQRIVEFREKNGPYKSVDDLLKVQGIGEKSLAKLRDRIVVGKAKK